MPKRKSLMQLVCHNPECGKDFTPYRKEQRYCSQKCKNHFHYKERTNAAKSWKEHQNKIPISDA